MNNKNLEYSSSNQNSDILQWIINNQDNNVPDNIDNIGVNKNIIELQVLSF